MVARNVARRRARRCFILTFRAVEGVELCWISLDCDVAAHSIGRTV